MIVTEFYKGQGLGNQLWCYVTTRVIAQDRGYDFGIMHPERFKGADFIDLDFGRPVQGGAGQEGGPPQGLPDGIRYYYCERGLQHPQGTSDIRLADPHLLSVPDNTKIDGLMQDEQYILHRKEEIRQWLQIRQDRAQSAYTGDGVCVMNFRGGEYVGLRDVFLTREYWENAMKHMLQINPQMRFVVITDDVRTAKKFFPKLEVTHFDIGTDYATIHNAPYLILSNSSFAWFPAWLNTRLKFCIAPKYWARHNVSDGYWSLGYNLTTGWQYLDREGKLSDYDTCQREFATYRADHPDYYPAAPSMANYSFVSHQPVVSPAPQPLSWLRRLRRRFDQVLHRLLHRV